MPAARIASASVSCASGQLISIASRDCCSARVSGASSRSCDRLHRPDNQRGTSYSRSVAARTRAGVCPSEPCRTTTSHGREGARHGGQARSRCRSQAPDGCALCGGIGQASAAILAREVFVRSFANRRQLGSYLGLTPSAYDSGSTSRCQGISKAGNSWARRVLIEIAWLWQKYQSGSSLSRWYEARAAGQSPRIRRIMLVALARKLAVALWRYVETGLIPDGAVMSDAIVPRATAA